MNPVSHFTFDNYITGDSNRLAYDAAKAVAESKERVCNPLFIYGKSGLGKTHLINAIYNSIRLHDLETNAILVSSEELTNDLVFAIKAKKEESWHAGFKGLDYLLIDDLDRLAGKQRTQREYVRIIQTVVDNGGRVVMTSSRPIEDMPVLERGLRNGFDCSLIADIQPLDAKLCKLLIISKAERSGLQLSDKETDDIASQSDGEVRKIEGILAQIRAKQTLYSVKDD